MKLSKEDEALLAQFASAALQGWLAREPENRVISSLNYGVIATGCYNMAKAMLKMHKVACNTAPKELADGDQ